jgi:nitrate reductase cytochrome c-type subunit
MRIVLLLICITILAGCNGVDIEEESKALWNNRKNQEISLQGYEEILKIKKEYPELTPEIQKAMEDYKITNEENSFIIIELEKIRNDQKERKLKGVKTLLKM